MAVEGARLQDYLRINENIIIRVVKKRSPQTLVDRDTKTISLSTFAPSYSAKVLRTMPNFEFGVVLREQKLHDTAVRKTLASHFVNLAVEIFVANFGFALEVPKILRAWKTFRSF